MAAALSICTKEERFALFAEGVILELGTIHPFHHYTLNDNSQWLTWMDCLIFCHHTALACNEYLSRFHTFCKQKENHCPPWCRSTMELPVEWSATLQRL
ncbi:hypothetical protein TNCV_2829721 [Trichonephila clavipes]|nr:hypothetical protein TNCV_2829721 [Trichonephila clavipes]